MSRFWCTRLFYNLHEEYVCSLKEIYIGQLVAARYVDNLWYRARIIGFRNGEFEMFYIDYGSSGVVTIDKIRHLPLHFTKLPVQAFRGRLYGIKPTSKDDKWTAEASSCFLKLIKGICVINCAHFSVLISVCVAGSRVIAAAKIEEECLMITDSEYETSYALTLVDTNSEEDIHIAEHLVEEGLAAVQYDDNSNGDFDACSQKDDAVNSALPTSAVSASSEEPAATPIVAGVQLASELEKRLTLSTGSENVIVNKKLETTLNVRIAENGTSTTNNSSSV